MASPVTRRARIAQIDQEIALLQAERDVLFNSLKFPIISLPVEITSQIFLHCIPGDPLSPGSFYPAVVLGQVCRQWREIALAVPDLWSAWSLAIDGNISRKRLLTGLNLWLARSRNRPLSFRLHHRDGAEFDPSQVDRWWDRVKDFDMELLPTVVSEHRRWKDVELNVPLTLLGCLSNAVSGDGLPYLTHLLLGSVQRNFWANAYSNYSTITLFADAPQLRNLHVVLEARYHLSLMDSFVLPYGQLTHFTGTLFGLRECLAVLVKMPLLVEAVFYVSWHATTVHVSSFTLPHLKSLKLYSTAPDLRLMTALQHLTLPALDTFLLGSEELAMPHVLSPFVLRSRCNIRNFACQFMGCDGLVQCLLAMPTLTTLELFDYDECEVVEALRYLDRVLEDAPTQIVPELQSVTIRCQKHDVGHAAEFPYKAVLILLGSLVTRPTPLQRFRLVWTTSRLPRRPNDWELGRFQRLVKDGMDVYIGTEEHSWIPAESITLTTFTERDWSEAADVNTDDGESRGG